MYQYSYGFPDEDDDIPNPFMRGAREFVTQTAMKGLSGFTRGFGGLSRLAEMGVNAVLPGRPMDEASWAPSKGWDMIRRLIDERAGTPTTGLGTAGAIVGTLGGEIGNLLTTGAAGKATALRYAPRVTTGASQALAKIPFLGRVMGEVGFATPYNVAAASRPEDTFAAGGAQLADMLGKEEAGDWLRRQSQAPFAARVAQETGVDLALSSAIAGMGGGVGLAANAIRRAGSESGLWKALKEVATGHESIVGPSVKLGGKWHTQDGAVLHAQIENELIDRGATWEDLARAKRGFKTSVGRNVSREKAAKIAERANQVSEGTAKLGGIHTHQIFDKARDWWLSGKRLEDLEAPKKDFAEDIFRTHSEYGGSTIDPRTGESFSGTEAYAVSPYKGREKIYDELTPEDVRQYIKDNQDLLSREGHTLGTWKSDLEHLADGTPNPNFGKHYLDISVTTRDLDEALRLGAEHNQEAVFDLKSFESIPVFAAEKATAQKGAAINELVRTLGLGGAGAAIGASAPPEEGQGRASTALLTGLGVMAFYLGGRKLSAGQGGYTKLTAVQQKELSQAADRIVTDPASYGATLLHRYGRRMKMDEWSRAMVEKFGDEVTGPGELRAVRKDSEKYLSEALDRVIRLPHMVGDKKRMMTFEEILDLAKSGMDEGGSWYDELFPVLKTILGNDEDAEMFVKCLAATSPQSQATTSNITFAKKAFVQWKLGMEPMSGAFPYPAFTRADGSLKAAGPTYENLRKAFAGEEFGDAKVRQFTRALLGDENAVVVDDWMSRLFGWGKKEGKAFRGRVPNPSDYLFAEQTIRNVAEELGKTPRDTQAAIWTGMKKLYEALGQTRPDEFDYARILKEKLVAPGTTTDSQIFDALVRGMDVNSGEVRFLADEFKVEQAELLAKQIRESANRAGFAIGPVLSFLARVGVGGSAGALVAPEGAESAGFLAGAGIGAGSTLIGRGAKLPIRTATVAVDADPIVKTVADQVSTTKLGSKLQGLTEWAGSGDKALKATQALLDESAMLREFGRVVGGSERLSHEISRGLGWQGGANRRLQDEFREVIVLSSGIEKNVETLAVAERGLELLRNGMGQKTLADEETLKHTIAQLSQDKDVKEAVEALRSYYRGLLDFKLANGVISQADYDAIIAKGEYYVPFVRDFGEDVLKADGVGGGKNVSAGKGERSMKPTKEGDVVEEDIGNPFERAILDTVDTHRKVAKQRITNIVARIVEDHPDEAAEFGIRKVRSQYVGEDALSGKVITARPSSKTGLVVEANVNGKKAYYEVTDKYLYETWGAMDPFTGNAFVKALGIFKKGLQEGVTLNPIFSVRNAIRDTVMASLQYPLAWKEGGLGAAVGAAAGARSDEDNLDPLRGALVGFGAGALGPTAVRTLDGLVSALKQDDLFKEFMREGGHGYGWYSRDVQGARKMIEQLKKSDIKMGDIVIPRDGPLSLIRTFNQAVEMGPRLARYKYLQKAGAGIPEAIHGARTFTLDFANLGSEMKGMAATNAFLNAQMQGWRKFYQMAKDPKTAGRAFAMIMVPSLALWSLNRENPEYLDRPTWEKNMFWLIPKGGEGGGFWRAPKPFEIGLLTASLPERIADYLADGDEEVLAHSVKDMASTYAGITNVPMTTAGRVFVELATNHDFFRNREINPHKDEYRKLPAEMQYTQRTTAPAKAVGEALNVSPAKVEHAVRGLGGTLGQEGLRALDRMAAKTGLRRRPTDPGAPTPFLGSLSTTDYSGSDFEDTFFRRLDRGERVFNAVKQIQKNEGSAAAAEYRKKHQDELRDYQILKTLEEGNKDFPGLQGLREQRKTILASSLDPEEKKKRLDRIDAMIRTNIQRIQERLR